MLEEIKNMFPDEEFLVLYGYDPAIVGVTIKTKKLVYSIEGIVKVLQTDGMTEDEAYEFFHYNIGGSCMGEKSPLFVERD